MSTDSEPTRQLDADERAQFDKLDAIREAKHDCINARKETKIMMQQGKNPLALNEMLHEALLTWLSELAPYKKMAPKYWSGTDDMTLGRVVASPPPSDSDAWREARPEEKKHPTNPVVLAEFEGLSDLKYPKTRFSATFERTKQRRHRGEQRMVATVPKAVDREILLRGCDWANQFAFEVGLDVPERDVVDETNEPV